MSKQVFRGSSVHLTVIAEGRLSRPGGEARFDRWAEVKKGAHGGTMGSPMQDV